MASLAQPDSTTSVTAEAKIDPRTLTTAARMKELRKKQKNLSTDIEDIMINYPATIKARKKMTAEGACSEAFVSYIRPAVYEFKENKEGKEEPVVIQSSREKEGTFIDCFKVGLNFLPDPAKTNKTVEKLNKPDTKDRTKKTIETLPIYIINAHSSVDPRISLEIYNQEKISKRAQEMLRRGEDGATPEAIIKEEREYSFIDQLESGLFSINIAPSKYNVKYTTRTDFFNTKPESNIYIIETAPIGFDAQCGDKNMAKFFTQASKDKFKTFRELLFSGKFKELFNQEQHEDNNEVKFFTPPGYSALNKSYQFFDDGKYGKDKWGIIKLTELSKEKTITINDFIYDKSLKLESKDVKLSQIHPQTKMKREILQSIKEDYDISLKTIVNKLGKGIYIDLGCSGIPMKVFDYEIKKYLTFSPDHTSRDEFGQPKYRQILPIYNVIMNDFEEIAYNQMLAWNNIVSFYQEKYLSTGTATDDDNIRNIENIVFANKLIDSSKKAQFDVTDVQDKSYSYSLKSEKIAETKYDNAYVDDSVSAAGQTTELLPELPPLPVVSAVSVEEQATPPQTPKKDSATSKDVFLGAYGGKRKKHTRKFRKRKTKKSRKKKK